MQPERVRAWLPAVLIAAIVTASVGLAAHALLQAGLSRSTPSVEEATRTGALAVGQAVADQFARALGFGIPLDRLPGIEPYLQRIAASSPQVDGLALLDGAGKTISATADGIEGVRFPISAGGTEATLVVAAASPLIDQAVRQVRIALAIAALLTGIMAGGIVACFVFLHRNPAQRRFLTDMDRVAAGDFTVRPAAGDGDPLSGAARALLLCIEKADAARRHLTEAVAVTRAIDFDGSLGRHVDRILQPIDGRYRFSDQADDRDTAGSPSNSGVVWRLALVLGFYGAAFPYVANFAIDRESEMLGAAWAPVMPLLAELAAASLGALLGAMRAGRSGTLILGGCLVLGVALAATYWCRTYDMFVVLRSCAGISAGFVAAGLLVHRRVDLRPRQLSVLLIFCALLSAPLLAGLYAEAIGRRSGFLVLGLAVLAAAPFVVMGRGPAEGAGGRSGRSEAGWPDVLLALTTLPAGAAILVMLPAGVGFNDYLLGAGATALLAAAALLVPALPPLACGAALLAAAWAIHASTASPAIPSMLIACMALGAAAGGGIKSFAGGAGRPWLALGLGAGAALILWGAAASFHLPFAAAVAGIGLVVLAGQFAGRRAAATEPAV